MVDGLTSHFNWLKPQISGSPTTWGASINSDLDRIDDVVFTNQTVANTANAAAVSAASAASTAQIAANTAQATAVAAQATASSAQTTATSALAGAAPIGSIVIWPSTTAPTNWLLCNGGTFNTTTYPALAAILGASFGAAGTLPNFNNSLAPGGIEAGNPFFGTIGSFFKTSVSGEEDFGFLGMNFIIRAL